MDGTRRLALIETAIGGLLPGRPYLVHGAPGVGKTILALQVAHAWTGVGRRVLFLTGEPPEQILQQASLLGLSLKRDWEEERFVLCRYSSRTSEQVGALGMAAFLDRLRGFAEPFSIGAVVLDPLVPLFRPYGRAVEVRRNVATLLDAWAEWGWSAMLLARTASLDRQAGLREGLHEQCWGVLELSHARALPVASPFLLQVEKSLQPGATGPVPYAIALEAGLVPVASRDEEAAGTTPAGVFAAAGAGQGRGRVLIACCNAEFLDPLVTLLMRRMEVEVASDGIEALARAASWKPDVVVVQQDLPGLSGLGLARALRRGRYAMPVLVLSPGGRRRSDRVRALLHGATDFVEHPFDARELASRIRMAARLRLAAPLRAPEDESWREALLDQAGSRELHTPEFLEALTVALRCAEHFSSPVSLIAFRLETDGDDGEDPAVRDAFRELIAKGTREGDLLCFPERDCAVALLCHEHRGGAMALAGRLRERFSSELGGASRVAGWRIDLASVTLESDALSVPPRALLDRLLEGFCPWLEGMGSVGARKATGTDGF